MRKPSHVIDVFLQPGEYYFGDRNTSIRTLLGSCVSITLWHPNLLIGGMCHYMLPTRGLQRGDPLDGRYADEALELLMQEIKQTGSRAAEYEAKLFGGSNMFADLKKKHCPDGNCDPYAALCQDVSCRNRHIAPLLAAQHGFSFKAENVGGEQPHNISFDIWSGHVWLKRPRNLLKPSNKLAIE